MSERQAGVTDEKAAKPEAEPEKAEEQATKPERAAFPGSASNTEVKEAAAPKRRAKAAKDMQAFAPKKGSPQKVRPVAPKAQGADAALRATASRGIDPGDTSAMAPVEVWRVMEEGWIVRRGLRTKLSRNARITRLTHDIESLQAQGIKMEIVHRG